MRNCFVRSRIIKVYSSGLVSQSFWFLETKKILTMIAKGATKKEIQEICLGENLFVVKNEYRSKRIFGYIWSRVHCIDSELLHIYISSDLDSQKVITLMLIMKNDKLFFEFMYEVYREKIIMGAPTLSLTDVNVFFKNKEAQSIVVSEWKEITLHKLAIVYLNLLAEANLVFISGDERKMTPPILDTKLEHYLASTENIPILKALTGVN